MKVSVLSVFSIFSSIANASNKNSSSTSIANDDFILKNELVDFKKVTSKEVEFLNNFDDDMIRRKLPEQHNNLRIR